MAVDLRKNFAYSTVATAPSPASSGTSLVVAAADGAKFPAVSFNAIIWPAGVQPTTANAEIVRVTAKATDTFTITRTQESTSARTVVVGDQIAAGLTDKSLKDIEDYLTGVTSPTLLTPTVASLTNAQHDHTNAAGGGALTFAGAPSGSVIQVVTTNDSVYASGTTTVPNDDTIPQNTEGNQFMSLAITPKYTTSTLIIEASLDLACSTSNDIILALFQDTTANAIYANEVYQATANGGAVISVLHTMTAGTTSATTFKIRVGAGSAATTYFNGVGGRRFGAIPKSTMKITEVKA